MNPSSRNHPRPTTRLVTGAGHHQHCIEAQTGWGSQKFVRTTGCYRIGKIKADNQTRTTAQARYPTTLQNSPTKTHADSTNLRQVRLLAVPTSKPIIARYIERLTI